MFLRLSLVFAVAVFSSSFAGAQTVTTSFGTGDGFVTGPTNGAAAAAGAFSDVTVFDNGPGTFSATFSGGQQQQMFDGPSYNSGPAALLFVNTGPGAAVFTGASGNTITGGANNGDTNGLISFSGAGASSVSFFAANRANGAAGATGEVFDTAGVSLGTFNIPNGGTSDFFFDSTVNFGSAAIGSIGFDLPGPASNAPYVVAIDSFSATAAVPEPSGVLALLGTLAIAGLRRRR